MTLDFLIGFLFGFMTSFFLVMNLFKRYIRKKYAFRTLIANMYHKDIMPEVCRCEGLINLATREHHHQYAVLALKEIRAHKEKILEALKKAEPFQ